MMRRTWAATNRLTLSFTFFFKKKARRKKTHTRMSVKGRRNEGKRKDLYPRTWFTTSNGSAPCLEGGEVRAILALSSIKGPACLAVGRQ